MGWKSKGRGGTLVDNEEKKEDGATCCLTLPLKLEKWQSDHLEKRFEIARQLYNTLVHAELKKKCQVERMPEYQEIMKMIDTASNQKEKWALEKKRKAFLEENGFSRNAFKADMEKYYKHFKDPPHNCAQTIHIIPATQISRKSAIQAHYLHTK